MLLIFGSRISEAIVNIVAFVCGYCGVRADQQVVKRSNRFTLFFIPLFSFSTSYLNRCTHCGGETALTAEQAQNSLRWSQSQSPA
ncbi:zinc-ribbon domain-containing protein [Amnibacterium flavum]|uniref:Zinc-ribbon domain-containing protein n=1 Tax=Amnibacterium flavum TaxID=2173173 RepID=A0A2V1HZ90_9MICO|nr:zinc-ribbon domain-containing protein [Amnibacterium flavum]PVZ95994.1 zinc-ribbon domain-containing protein [Amnibacterium flavum]